MSRRSDMRRSCDDANHCITCGDDGVPERVLAIDEARCLALCETTDGDARRESVEIALVAPVAVGDTVLVHAGTALARLTDVVA
jgi:hydrogenase maturation factor